MAKTPPADTRLQLDENDPDDARIIARQRRAARTAGRNGRDRAATTRGRPDLEKAFDEGAQEPTEEPAEEEPAAPTPSAWSRTKSGAGAAKARLNKLGAPLSKGSWRPRTTVPSRARDVGGLATGALVYIGVIVYIRYGPAGWKGWLKAKFLNQPMQGLPTDQKSGSTATVRPGKGSGVHPS